MGKFILVSVPRLGCWIRLRWAGCPVLGGRRHNLLTIQAPRFTILLRMPIALKSLTIGGPWLKDPPGPRDTAWYQMKGDDGPVISYGTVLQVSASYGEREAHLWGNTRQGCADSPGRLVSPTDPGWQHGCCILASRCCRPGLP